MLDVWRFESSPAHVAKAPAGCSGAVVGIVGDVDLVGRDDDLGVLHSFADQVRRAGGTLLLFGEPGVGKTVLLGATAAYATAVGTRVLRASGTSSRRRTAFRPFTKPCTR
jgi:hypothetical protein